MRITIYLESSGRFKESWVKFGDVLQLGGGGGGERGRRGGGEGEERGRDHLIERMMRERDTFRSHLLTFLSTLVRVFEMVCPFKVTF